MNTYIGIDPGLDGGVAICYTEGNVIKNMCTFRTPTIAKTQGRGKRLYDINLMRNILLPAGPYTTPVLVALEKTQAMPGQGVSSMWSIGYGQGLWEGLLKGLNYPYVIVHPKKWQSVVCADIPGGPKERALLFVQRFFPNHDFRATPKSKKAHQGLVDAACLAYYASRV